MSRWSREAGVTQDIGGLNQIQQSTRKKRLPAGAGDVQTSDGIAGFGMGGVSKTSDGPHDKTEGR